MCHKPMRLMLVKGMGGRKMQCIDCGQPDPLENPDTQRCLKGDSCPSFRLPRGAYLAVFSNEGLE